MQESLIFQRIFVTVEGMKLSKFKVLLYLKKMRIRQAGQGSYHGTYHPQSLELVRLPEQELNGTVLMQIVL